MAMVFTSEGPGHPLIFANDAFLSLTGYEREEVLGKSFHELLAVGVGEDAVDVVKGAFRGDSVDEVEIRYRRKDGSEFWASMLVSPVLDNEGRVVQQFVSFADLTSQGPESARGKMLSKELKSTDPRKADALKLLGLLTPREQQVLDGVTEGLPNKLIAYRLHLSPRTVESYRAHLTAKLGMVSVPDLVRLRMRAGVVDAS
jgi:PAS domain S-box-containing protein